MQREVRRVLALLQDAGLVKQHTVGNESEELDGCAALVEIVHEVLRATPQHSQKMFETCG